jgi:hypothetical protein
VAKLFLGKQFLRHGRISVPLFEGIAPPEEFVEEVNHVSLEEAVVNFLAQDKISYYAPRSLVVLAQGEQGRFEEVTGRLEPGAGATGAFADGPGPYAHRLKRKLVRRANIPEFDAVETMPAGVRTSAITLENTIAPSLIGGESAKDMQVRVNDRVTECMKNGGLEEFKTGVRKMQRSKSLFQRFFN